jgi:hypothetical protein
LYDRCYQSRLKAQGNGPLTFASVPPNVKFEIDDVESPWLHSYPFDFIFCRYMAACIVDWPRLVKNVYECVLISCSQVQSNFAYETIIAADHIKHSNLSSSGWAEFQDFNLMYYSDDGTLNENHETAKWLKALLDGARMIGRDPCPGPKLEDWVNAAGFENVVHQKFKLPIGPWPKDPKLKEVGLFNLTQILSGLEGFSLRLFCDVLQWRQEEVLVMMAKVRKELKTPGMHLQLDL